MPEKIAKIQDAKFPSSKTEIRAFLGLAGFYRKFVPNFSAIAKPLTDATKKGESNTVKQTPERERAFQQIKDALKEEPICKLPDLSKPFLVRTDASGKGLGAILMQGDEENPSIVACASRKLSPAEQNYAVIERECLAIVWAIEKFNPYLYGKHFTIQTDHNPLKFLHSMKLTNPRLTRWSLQLQPYSFTVESIPGKENVGADWLSRTEMVGVSG